VFFEECCREKVICVPGVFFDVNPGGIRRITQSKCINHVRFSYGPPKENLYLGMQKVEQIINRWKPSEPNLRRNAKENPSRRTTNMQSVFSPSSGKMRGGQQRDTDLFSSAKF
jgi:hypothetical protein